MRSEALTSPASLLSIFLMAEAIAKKPTSMAGFCANQLANKDLATTQSFDQMDYSSPAHK
jgi:hypothetical protein